MKRKLLLCAIFISMVCISTIAMLIDARYGQIHMLRYIKTEHREVSSHAVAVNKAINTEVAAETPLEFDTKSAEAIAKLVWGEARGCTATEQAAVVWCVLNRVDDGRWPDTILDVVSQPMQFQGYSSGNPVDDSIYTLVCDVMTRWLTGCDGRVLPKEYVYFLGDGQHNHFTTGFKTGDTWDWSLPSPYV